MRLFKNLKVSKKIVLGFLIMSIFMTYIGIAGLKNMNNVKNNLEMIYSNDLKGLTELYKIKNNITEISSRVLMIVQPENYENISSLSGSIDILAYENDNLIESYKTTIVTEEDRMDFESFEKALLEYRSLRSEVSKLAIDKKYLEAKDLLSKISEKQQNINTQLNKNIKIKEASSEKNYNESIETYNKSKNMTVMIIVGALITAIILATLIAKNISNQLSKLSTLSKYLSNRDLSQSVEDDSKDEIGQAIRELNIGITSVRELIAEVTDNSLNISTTSKELSVVIEDVNGKINAINQSTEQISQGVEELSATTEEVSASTQEISSTAQKLYAKAENSNKSADEIKK